MPINFTSKSLLILTWNPNGLANHKNEILAILQTYRIDIALISETHFTNSSIFNLPGYKTFKTNHPDGTAQAGAAIIVRSSLFFSTLSPISNHLTYKPVAFL
jgi:exonuclease III|uniref:RNA-directed DNA polymerase from mobile element jockey n=1 Tax=Sipha flava TaxID=143950 RepID=A0A2S2PZV7_9HEMI